MNVQRMSDIRELTASELDFVSGGSPLRLILGFHGAALCSAPGPEPSCLMPLGSYLAL
jgi:hypothetical protein